MVPIEELVDCVNRLIHPGLYKAGLEVMKKLHGDRLQKMLDDGAIHDIYAAASIWPSSFSGIAVVAN